MWGEVKLKGSNFSRYRSPGIAIWITIDPGALRDDVGFRTVLLSLSPRVFL